VADTKRGLDIVGSELTYEVIDDQTYWFSASMPSTIELSQTAFLLPTYDEFLVGYAGFDKSRRAGQEVIRYGTFDPTLVIGGKVVGSWRRTINKGTVVIELAPFAPLTVVESEIVSAAIQRYAEYVEMPVVLS
jgi:hypothetical protein